MKISVSTGKIDIKNAEAVIIPMFNDDQLPSGLPKIAVQLLEDAYQKKEFAGKIRQVKHVVIPTGNQQALRHVYLFGLSSKKGLKMKDIGEGVGAGVRNLKQNKVKNIAVLLTDSLVDSMEDEKMNLAETVTEYAVMADYDFSEYLKKKKPSVKNLSLYVPKDMESLAKSGVKTGQLGANIVNECREMVNRPGSSLTPSDIADYSKKTAENHDNLRVKILNEKEMAELGMGAILGVSRGSVQEAKFIVMEYWGAEDKKEKPYVIVGKGVTFDSGGLSIKPSEAMPEMKMDMAGGAAVVHILKSAAAFKLPVNVVGLVPSSENMPGSNAMKPGDIVKAMDGTTIEVLNTDAEGRMLLADALVYARRYKPAAVVDLATLTGACMVALHDYASGIFTHDLDLFSGLDGAGYDTGDQVWDLPMPDEFRELMKSKVADIANIAAVRTGGASTAAIFLQHFVANKYPWAHIDIAPTAWFDKGKKHLAPGASGAGVRLVVQWLRDLC